MSESLKKIGAPVQERRLRHSTALDYAAHRRGGSCTPYGALVSGHNFGATSVLSSR